MGVSRVVQEIYVAWHSLQLPEQMEDLFSLCLFVPPFCFSFEGK